jgi:spore coat polysaccharide biosynthesis predicted glycosyltransferase SpsG
MWERCYLGLPSAVVIQADNQREAATWVSNMGAAWCIGEHHQVMAEHYVNIMNKVLSFPQALKDMSRRGLELTAGNDDGFRSEAAQALLSCLN